MYKLIPLTDFVLDQCEKIPKSGQVMALFNIFSYTKFIKKEIDIEMFCTKALFKGFEIDKKNKAFVNNENSISISYIEGVLILNGNYIETIDDLTTYGLKLTDYAVYKFLK